MKIMDEIRKAAKKFANERKRAMSKIPYVPPVKDKDSDWYWKQREEDNKKELERNPPEVWKIR